MWQPSKPPNLSICLRLIAALLCVRIVLEKWGNSEKSRELAMVLPILEV
ncbi:hypothetical protein SLEP1_g18966 [Rubroshorea leprosula]|uniref:Uncharacterized protein n=1 Tax=Rubroshorea leprosula TaxID=152421 RepID=A0AAV5J2P2_9ROSI|nr:hypothetical protein SLEP1_g18966 [Rubroshorea leprosula]